MAPNTPNGLANQEPKAIFTREEVFQHRKKDDCWIILEGEVYNVTPWLKKHPGGARVVLHYGGEDATIAWTSFHNDLNQVKKYLTAFHIGTLQDGKMTEIDKDFLKLRSSLKEKGFFKPSVPFFIAHFLHIYFFFFATWGVLWYFGNTWATWLIAAVFMTTCQAQSGWLQHDFGHLSVFNSSKLNHAVHDITIGLMKGVSSWWWNYRHFQHHAKPNVHMKDPDITAPYLFLFGKVIPEKWGRRRLGIMPYRIQHLYFFFLGPPLLLPIYFHLEVLFYTFKRKLVKDFLLMVGFYLIFHFTFAPLMGGFWGNFRWYFFIRFLESHWFVWVTQMSHLPMHVDTDKRDNWVSMQLKGTTDVETSFLIDWFSGHLNFQIEHHLFPTMPRNQFAAVKPYVVEFCKKHDIKYHSKTFYDALADIVRSLKESSDIWADAYDAHIPLKAD
ncbi:acyl-CoA 6-desaturase-like [Halichondria panicea]|uniref:acyl-CoA 6-desaturase-like n=1 Tax=Halichondria panicea TaxID=6063 RepID=UPI00312B546E